MGNDEVSAAVDLDNKSPTKLGPSAQRAENLRRRKALAGTSWSLGSKADMQMWGESLTTDYQNQFKNHMTQEGLDILETSRINGKESKKRLQKTTLELGRDPDYL